MLTFAEILEPSRPQAFGWQRCPGCGRSRVVDQLRRACRRPVFRRPPVGAQEGQQAGAFPPAECERAWLPLKGAIGMPAAYRPASWDARVFALSARLSAKTRFLSRSAACAWLMNRRAWSY